ncbi:16S rRNA (adenine(1518)-N(6)/adenine(1519)-N(6))-dimethyltransferase RsmA [Buchnera aphidicola (Ceratoglyphina bambusae)]|uniref:16S rRNA (adenine(1518)-N(6)/adenine(1519)-N(6))- dimethyltransferase RsmA n=1 Tax=Buchnera aphidicola TaxID=9 RepID=UPI0031B7F8AF
MKNFLYKNFKIKKELGQNFLIDYNVKNNIINYINLKENDTIFEIGPGFGHLTEFLFKHVKKLSVIEIDDKLTYFLKKKFFNKRINIFNKNVLKFNFFKYNTSNNLIRIVGNLPYNISVPIIFHCLSFIKIIKDIHFMVQYEVGNKISAPVNNKFYSKLSIFVQYYFLVKKIFKIDSKSFYPSPKVKSYFIKLIPRKKNIYKKININNFKYIVSTAFQQRRKILKNSLSKIFSENTLINLGINPFLRAQNLTILEYCVLTENFSK